MKQEYNLDINPKQHTRALFPTLTVLYETNRLRVAFNEKEALAARYKSRYWVITKLAIFLISLSVIFAISFWLFAESFPNLPLRQVAGYAGILGIVGAALEIFLIFAKTKERWLLNRFLAERLRSYVAQLYAVGAATKTEAELESVTELYTTRTLAALDSDAQMGKAAFRRFRPQQGIIDFDIDEEPSNKVLIECQKAYQLLRVEFQKKFVKGEIEKLQDRGRIESSVTDMAFVFGVVFTLIGLLVLPFSIPDPVSKGLVLCGVLLFFFSAILGLTGTGNVSQADTRRYQTYLDQIEALPEPTDDTPKAFISRIRDMELEAMRELEAFCMQVDSVSVRI